MYWTYLIVTESHLAKTCSPSVGAFSNMDAFSNTLQNFYHTSVSSAIAIKLLNWCVSGASPVQETVLWNISFEVLMYPLSINLAGAKDEQGEVSRGSNVCADYPAGFASWEVLPALGFTCAGPFARAKGVDRVVFLVTLSLFMAVQEQAPGLHLLLTGCSPLVWWFSFHPGKVPLASLCCMSLSGLSLLSWEQVGHLTDRWRAETPCPACSVSSQLAQGQSPGEGAAGLTPHRCHELIGFFSLIHGGVLESDIGDPELFEDWEVSVGSPGLRVPPAKHSTCMSTSCHYFR